jgi:hypothetical protein
VPARTGEIGWSWEATLRPTAPSSLLGRRASAPLAATAGRNRHGSPCGSIGESPQMTTNSLLEPSVSFAPPERHDCSQRILRRQQSKSNPLLAVRSSTTDRGPRRWHTGRRYATSSGSGPRPGPASRAEPVLDPSQPPRRRLPPRQPPCPANHTSSERMPPRSGWPSYANRLSTPLARRPG